MNMNWRRKHKRKREAHWKDLLEAKCWAAIQDKQQSKHKPARRAVRWLDAIKRIWKWVGR